MFSILDAGAGGSLRPASSDIAPSDWAILASFWYPVAHVDEVDDRPHGCRLLDVDLVLYRSATGITAARDICPHRHIRLSAGGVEDGQIVCPFHGLAFDGGGQCTRVPALGRAVRLPASYKVRTFRTAERYGLVWVCLDDESDRPLPIFPSVSDTPAGGLVYLPTRDWPVSSARQVENFFDLGHLPIIHGATLGGDPGDPVRPGRIEQHEDGVALHAAYVEKPFGGTERPCTYIYRVILPFAIDFTVIDDTGHDMKLFDIASPVSAHRCRVFQFMKDTREAGEHHRALIEGLDAVNLEDIALLSELAVPDLPLDARSEIHLPVDNISHAYRDRLRALGLGAGS